jgi:hypothetical protein
MTIQNLGAFTLATLSQILNSIDSLYSTLAAAVTTGAIPANVLTGGLNVFLNSAATTPGNQTTRTAAQLWQDLQNQWGIPLSDPSFANGLTYYLQITQTGSGTLTLVGGTGVTITGTATIPQNTTREFAVNLQPTAATFTAIGTGTYS